LTSSIDSAAGCPAGCSYRASRAIMLIDVRV